VKKSHTKLAQSLSVTKLIHSLPPRKKVAQNCGLLLLVITKTLPKVNNCPIGQKIVQSGHPAHHQKRRNNHKKYFTAENQKK
jgi:hypothetical protein